MTPSEFSICFLQGLLKRGPAPKNSIQGRKLSKEGHQWCASVADKDQSKGEAAGGAWQGTLWSYVKVHMTKQDIYQPLPGPETSKSSYESTYQEGLSYTLFLAPPLPKFDPTLCPNYKGASIGLSQIRKVMEKERES